MLLATWNVLADAYVRPDWYRGVPAALLEPRRRRARVIERAKALAADVLCLQEVEEGCAAGLEAALAPLGYSSHFAQKGGGKPDGCATFVRGARVVDARPHFYEDGSGHLALLTHLDVAGTAVLVANTHLKWDDPVKESGARWCVLQARSLARALGPSGAAVVCGDLNVRPGDPTLAELEAAGLRDAFDGSDEPHTCLANGRTARIDHVFVRRLAAAPRWANSVRGVASLPSEAEPSDHVPLVVEVTFA